MAAGSSTLTPSSDSISLQLVKHPLCSRIMKQAGLQDSHLRSLSFSIGAARKRHATEYEQQGTRGMLIVAQGVVRGFVSSNHTEIQQQCYSNHIATRQISRPDMWQHGSAQQVDRC